jgi:Cu2+-exporting ATPase
MLFLDVGIIGAVYLGSRLIETYRKRKAQKNGAPDESGKNNAVPENRALTESKTSIEKLPDSENAEDRAVGKVSMLHVKASIALIILSVLRMFFPIVYPLQMAVVCFVSFPIFRRAEAALIEEKKLRAPVLTSVFLLACVVTGQYVALGIGGIFFLSAARIVAKTRRDLKNRLTGIFEELPDSVWILRDGIEIEIPLNEVCAGDIVAVMTGNIVPVDGIVTEGQAAVDEHTLTGEFQPAEKTAGDWVFASTVVMNGRIRVKVEKTGEETAAAKIEDILNNTADFKSDLQLKGEKWADQSVLPALGASLISLPFVHLFGAAAILNCGFEARIMMLAPLGTLNHLHISSRKAIFIKDGRALEQANQTDTVLFDKTGTLTADQPEIGQIAAFNGYDENTILCYAATAECKMAHPIAKAIVEKAEQSGIQFSEPEDSAYTIGYGITVKIGAHTVRVGSVRFMKTEGIPISEIAETLIENFHEKGHSAVMVAVDEQLGGIVELCPSLRPEVEDIIKGLRERGVKHLSIVSGDQEKPVRKLAEQLGMDSYFAEILPENKAAIVEQLQEEGKTVCFVGDGINDSIAMKKADLSVSLSGATSVAMDVAQVVMTDGTLANLCDLFDISNGLKTNSKKTLGIMLAGTAANVAGVFLLHFGVTATIIVNVISLAAGGVNTMKPLITSGEKFYKKTIAMPDKE